MLSVGAGIWANASEAFDNSPSRRPVGTFQEGPPFNTINERQRKHLENIVLYAFFIYGPQCKFLQ